MKANLDGCERYKMCKCITLNLALSASPFVIKPEKLFSTSFLLDREVKIYYLLQLAFWFSSSIRNVEAYFKRYQSGAESEYCSKAALLYLLSCLMGFLTNHSEGGVILISIQYLSELSYQTYRLLWIFGWEKSFNVALLMWSIIFVFCRFLHLGNFISAFEI